MDTGWADAVKNYRPRHKWTPSEVAILTKRYASEHTTEIAKLIGVTPLQVFTKANALGIHKTKDFLRDCAQSKAATATGVQSIDCVTGGRVITHKIR